MAVVALAILVFERTDSAYATAALFLAARFAPALLAPPLTARLDQLAVGRSLPCLYLAEAVLFGVLAFVASHFALAAVLALVLVDGSIALTARSLSRGAVAAVLPADRLRDGNALINVGFAVASVGGAALGGWLTGSIGVGAALLADAASFVVAGAIIATSHGMPPADEGRETLVVRLREGLRHAARAGQVRWFLLGQAGALVCFTLVLPVEVVYAKETLHTTASGYGALLAAWGAGLVIGSALFLRLSKRSLLTTLLGSTAAIGVAYLGMSQVSTLAAACALSVLGGTGNGIQWVSVVTALQDATPADLQARTVGLMESINAAVPGAGFLLGGLIASVFSAPTAFGVAGVAILLLVAAGAVVLRPRSDGGRWA